LTTSNRNRRDIVLCRLWAVKVSAIRYPREIIVEYKPKTVVIEGARK